MPCGYIRAYSPSSSRRSDKVGELGCTRHLRAGALQRGAVEMLAVGRDARCAAGSKRAGAVLVRMQEDSQKEPRWQARWTADSRDTARRRAGGVTCLSGSAGVTALLRSPRTSDLHSNGFP